MKITAVDVLPVEVPVDHPYGQVQAVNAAVARVRIDEGLEGIGHAMPLYSRGSFRSLVAAMEDLGEMLLGDDPRQPEALHARISPNPPGGVGTMATAGLDVAVWDLAAKAAGLPLWRVLGGFRGRVPAYASLRLGRDKSAAEAAQIAGSLKEQGFKAMKTNLGPDTSVSVAVERIRGIREVIGYDVKLMVDVNSLWTPSTAIRVGHELEEFELFWIEDPAPTHNLSGLAEIKASLRTPVMAGETLYGYMPFRPLFESGAVDLVMPDIMRVGGITPYRKVAHMAEAFGIPCASHLMPEISASVVASVPNGVIVEYVAFAEKLFRNTPRLENGDLVLSEQPGHGLELDEEFAKAHRL
ncbi:MAG TPA: mandelate racemase/muconate lactonizing enzyme family protein [Chloroflexota bacterium]|nr:mandelate racemase/muconate lactonizing enzyme family protein [Chloroflexota bacterium]